MLKHEFDDLLDPPGHVGLPAEVGQRSFWAADLVFEAGDFVGEGDQELPKPPSLVKRQHQNTRQIPLLQTILLPGKVPHQMIPEIINLRENKKRKRRRVPLKRFVIQKKLRQIAKILRVHRILRPIDLKHRNLPIRVDLIPRRTGQLAALAVIL